MAVVAAGMDGDVFRAFLAHPVKYKFVLLCAQSMPSCLRRNGIRADNTLIAFHGYRNYVINEVEVVSNTEFVVTDVVPMSKAEAKKEMKDNTEDPDFVVPNVLPKLGFRLGKELKDMEATGLIEDFSNDPL